MLTHGFVMAEDGRKMSKSLGNSIAPQDVIKQSGAEVLRLWASMVDYREDIRIGKEILTRTVEAYRKIRNVLRVLVANLYDFDPADESVPLAKMEEIDRWLLARYAECAARIVKAWDDYDYPTVFQTANQFITVDVSAFYVDVTKDRMYTFGASLRSAALGADGDVRRRRRPGAAAGADPVGDDGRAVARPAGPRARRRCTWRCSRATSTATPTRRCVERWAGLGAVRDAVNLALEQKRQDKTIGGNLSAAVELTASGGPLADCCARYEAFLPTLFGVSAVTLRRAAAGDGRSRASRAPTA